MAALTKAQAPVKPLVIEASGMIDVDYTGSQILQQTIARLRSRSIEAAIARLSDERAEAEASRTGLIAALGPERIFKSVEEPDRSERKAG
jgi:sulfate permease, SulP family